MTQPSADMKPRAAQTILITGASGSIGNALAKAYAAPGITLILHGRNESKLEQTAQACRAQGAQVVKGVFDITDTNTLQNWVQDIDAMHPIDLLIANQGMNINIGPEGKGESWEQTNLLLDVNLRASMAMVHAALPGMRKRGRGQVVLISSLAAYFGLPLTPAYSASKAGLKAYGEGLRGWLAPEGVGVTVIMPGYVKSEMCDAMPGPKTLVWSPDKAARVMKQGIAKNKARITFPFFVSFETWLLAVLPASWSLKILKIAGYHV
jgi:short-subunit dehydrogenase